MAAGKKLNEGQREMVTIAYKYFENVNAKAKLSARQLCSLVALCLGISPVTVWRVCCACSAQEVAENAEEHALSRPPTYQLDDIAPFIRQIVQEAKKNMVPCTSKSIADELESRTSVRLSSRTMRRVLHQLGYRYVQGEKRHYHAESVTNVAYRATYLQRKLANRDQNNNPIRPEVFLDESYVNQNHVTGNTWLERGATRVTASGKGMRICIVAAGIIYRWGYGLRSDIVPDSLYYWKSQQKCKNDEDYHGNFNSVLFQRWFGKLCQTLKKYGSCIIYMDGASYHKENIVKTPTTKTKKAEIQEWLQNNAK